MRPLPTHQSRPTQTDRPTHNPPPPGRETTHGTRLDLGARCGAEHYTRRGTTSRFVCTSNPTGTAMASGGRLGPPSLREQVIRLRLGARSHPCGIENPTGLLRPLPTHQSRPTQTDRPTHNPPPPDRETTHGTRPGPT
ncbi:hypothetical protein GCM10009677_55580 [Sphaerisporangium rubeum]